MIDNYEMIRNIDTNELFNLIKDQIVNKEMFNDMYINLLLEVYNIGLYQGMYRRDKMEQEREKERLRYEMSQIMTCPEEGVSLEELEKYLHIQLEVKDDKS